MTAGRWDAEGDAVLRAEWGRVSLDEIAALVRRAPRAVERRAAYLNLTSQRDFDAIDRACGRWGTSRQTLKAVLQAAGIPCGRRPGGDGQRACNLRMSREEVDRAMAAYLAARSHGPRAKAAPLPLLTRADNAREMKQLVREHRRRPPLPTTTGRVTWAQAAARRAP